MKYVLLIFAFFTCAISTAQQRTFKLDGTWTGTLSVKGSPVFSMDLKIRQDGTSLNGRATFVSMTDDSRVVYNVSGSVQNNSFSLDDNAIENESGNSSWCKKKYTGTIEVKDQKIVISGRWSNDRNYAFIDKYLISLNYSPCDPGTFYVSKTDNSHNTFNAAQVNNKPSTATNLQVPVSSSNNVAGSNEQYRSMIEELITHHYEGWKYDKLYEKGSLSDITVTSSDARKNPLKIKANCKFKIAGYSDGWVEVLFSENIPHSIIFWDQPTVAHTTVNGKGKIPEQKIRMLQNHYLLEAIKSVMSKYYTNLSCLVEDIYEHRSPDFSDVKKEDLWGNSYTQKEYAGQKVTFTEDGYRNKCDVTVFVKGIMIISDRGTIEFKNASTAIGPGTVAQISPKWKIFKGLKDSDLPVFLGDERKDKTILFVD